MTDLWADPDFVLDSLEADPDPPADGKVLVAGALFDAETGEELDDGDPCDHADVQKDDDGLRQTGWVCLDCEEHVEPSEPDEDGHVIWEVVE